MKIGILKSIALIVVSIIGVSTVVIAESKYENQIKLIDLAGKQRMLSQRITKAYLYAGKNIAPTKARKQLKKSLILLSRIQNALKKSIQDEYILNLLDFVEMTTEELTLMLAEDFDIDNAKLIIDFGESMLEGSRYIVNALKKEYNNILDRSEIVAISGRQRMLSQRIAKYYIAYKLGIRDDNTVAKMKESVKLFNKSHIILMKHKNNTHKITRKLNKVDRLWKIVYKFYINIEKGRLPLIVFNTTDDIAKKMSTITNLYVDLYE